MMQSWKALQIEAFVPCQHTGTSAQPVLGAGCEATNPIEGSAHVPVQILGP